MSDEYNEYEDLLNKSQNKNTPDDEEDDSRDESEIGLLETLKAFIHAPKEIIGLNIINIFEGMAYFGVLTLLVPYLNKNVGLDDVSAGFTASGFLILITFSQLLFGGQTDKFGPKKMLGISIFALLISRIILGFSELAFGTASSTLFGAVVVSLAVAGLAYGVFNPAVYSITRMYSNKKTSAVSYAMLYGGMNLGAFLIGLILPFIRDISGDVVDEKTKEIIHQGLIPGSNGYSGALIFIAGIMIVVLLLYFIFIAGSKTAPISDIKGDDDITNAPPKKLTLKERLKNHPLRDLKFDFFIFILIPVQTIFAYQNILIPTYLERCFRDYPAISNHFETFSNINPLIVFLCAPTVAALTSKQNVYTMMIIGTAIMAVPTFLLAIDTTPTLFLTFIVIGAIGESLWQPRFLQHVTEIAPKDRVGAYVGIANLPWFLTKFIVGIYIGFFMREYIPDPSELAPGVTQNPQTMWFIFACIACISPIALFVARKWMEPKHAK